MIRKLIILSLWVVPLFLQAQVTISVQVPPAGLIQKEQLWNLMLSNSGSSTLEVNVLLNLQDAVTGQSVLSAGTRNIFLAKGVRMLSITDVQPIQYNYGLGGSGTYLPLGSYIACYTVTRSIGEKIESVGEECVRININPLSPPLLNTPVDKAILQTPPQQFTWVPPAPLNMFDNLSYDIAVAEVLEGQSPSDAVLYNIPLFSRKNGKLTSETYPSTFRKLEKGKTYAWQVTARNTEGYSVPTEVWTFQVADDLVTHQQENNSYILLKRGSEPSGVAFISQKQLLVKYYSYDKKHKVTIRLLNDKGEVVDKHREIIQYGDNLLSFNLKNSFRSGRIYSIELRDLQNNLYKQSFSIK